MFTRTLALTVCFFLSACDEEPVQEDKVPAFLACIDAQIGDLTRNDWDTAKQQVLAACWPPNVRDCSDVVNSLEALHAALDSYEPRHANINVALTTSQDLAEAYQAYARNRAWCASHRMLD